MLDVHAVAQYSMLTRKFSKKYAGHGEPASKSRVSQCKPVQESEVSVSDQADRCTASREIRRECTQPRSSLSSRIELTNKLVSEVSFEPTD